MDPKQSDVKPLDITVDSKEGAHWKNLKDTTDARIIQQKVQSELDEVILKFAKKRYEEEKLK